MKVKTETCGRRVRIYPMSDLHWPIHDERKLDAWAEAVADDEDAVITLGGDLLDMARGTARNHIATYTGDLTSLQPFHDLAMSQAEDLAKYLRPLREKIVAAVAGNHHWRFQDGTISDQAVCRFLHREDAWCGAFGMVRLDLRLGKKTTPCKVALHHDAGKRGGTLGADVNAFIHWSHAVDAHVYIAGHTHRQWAMPAAACITVPDEGEARVDDTKRIFVRSGAWMKSYPEGGADCKAPYLPEYAVEKMLPPTILGIVSVGVAVKPSGDLAFSIGHQTL